MKKRLKKESALLYPGLILLIVLLIFSPWGVSLAATEGSVLSLESFLSQVEGKNENLKAAKETTEGALLRTSESKLFFSPSFFAEAQIFNDHEQNALFPASYEKLRTDTYSLGFSENTPWGMGLKLSYTLNNADYVPRPRFWEGSPRLEVSQSLWRNFLGSEMSAQKTLLSSGAKATQYQQSFQTKLLRAEAESAYIRLAAAQELVQVYEDSFQLAQELLQWSTKRAKLNLSESSDLFQSQAHFEGSKLNLQSAKDEMRSASRNFNRMRNINSDEVKEKVILFKVEGSGIPKRAQFRDDVLAAQEGLKIAAAQAQLGLERNRPDLTIYASRALNSRAADRSTAFKDSFHSDTPTTVVGVKFQTPLLLNHSFSAIEGYKKERNAAENLTQQKLFEQEVQWSELVHQFEEAKKRFEIAENLLSIQKKKSENERKQLKRGRSTTYQVLSFDQDLNNAQVMKIQTQSQLLSILTQMKTFGEN